MVAQFNEPIACPATIDQLQELVRQLPQVLPCGGGTKTALSNRANLSMARLAGLVEYQPQEFTFTALAGTRVSELQAALEQNGQFLPFDPVQVEAGSTIGGTIASGLSGPGRFRYGPLRDFLVGVRFLTSDGRLIYGGGRVVKNAAGFDLPKLMVGSLGTLGVLVEATFKVFPRPAATATLRIEYRSWAELLDDLTQWTSRPWDFSALDIEPPGCIWIRISGEVQALAQRIDRCSRAAQGRIELWENEADYWRQVREFRFVPSGFGLARVAFQPQLIPEFEAEAEQHQWGPRRYSAAGHALWVCLPERKDWDQLDKLLQHLGRPGCAILGPPDVPICLGNTAGGLLAERLRRVFDPLGKFVRPTTGTASHDQPVPATVQDDVRCKEHAVH